MKAYRVEKKVAANGVLTLRGLPFQEGENVEIIILPSKIQKPALPMSTIRGKVIEYIDPMEPVGQDDWEVVK